MRKLLAVLLGLAAVFAGGAARVVQDQCGPFTDVTPAFCPYILELYYLGVTAGTSATTFSPDDPLTRGQGAVFVAKGLNQALARSSRRAALGQWWIPGTPEAVGLTGVGSQPLAVQSDGADLWVANSGDATVSRVRASDGRLLETWTGATGAKSVLVAMGRVFVVGMTNPGKLYLIDPTQPAGPVSSVADLGVLSSGIAFDGSRIWVANFGTGSLDGSLSLVTPGTWSVTDVPNFNHPEALVWDGSNMWVTQGLKLSKLDENGAVLLDVALNFQGHQPAFDGANIWVPTSDGAFGEIVVVRASTAEVIQNIPQPDTLDSGLRTAAFDGQRILVTDYLEPRMFVWNASDLSLIGTFQLPNGAFGACSDGINFWMTLRDSGQLARF